MSLSTILNKNISNTIDKSIRLFAHELSQKCSMSEDDIMDIWKVSLKEVAPISAAPKVVNDSKIL